MISGLLSMSEAGAGSSRRDIQRCLRQVRAIATVHDLLSPMSMSGELEVRECLTKVAGSAILAAGSAQKIDLNVSGEERMLRTDEATAVGLIVNELVSNALEHGFCGRDSGHIEIKIYRHDQCNVVDVIDDGVGLPEGFAFQAAPDSASGLSLAASLADYGLSGRLDITGTGVGVLARIRF
jgi:two-component system, sensor histidine kinase PdtaS